MEKCSVCGQSAVAAQAFEQMTICVSCYAAQFERKFQEAMAST